MPNYRRADIKARIYFFTVVSFRRTKNIVPRNGSIGPALCCSGNAKITSLYYYHSELLPLFLITIFGKNEKLNLTKTERLVKSYSYVN